METQGGPTPPLFIYVLRGNSIFGGKTYNPIRSIGWQDKKKSRFKYFFSILRPFCNEIILMMTLSKLRRPCCTWNVFLCYHQSLRGVLLKIGCFNQRAGYSSMELIFIRGWPSLLFCEIASEYSGLIDYCSWVGITIATYTFKNSI